jgi:hypothetical protein
MDPSAVGIVEIAGSAIAVPAFSMVLRSSSLNHSDEPVLPPNFNHYFCKGITCKLPLNSPPIDRLGSSEPRIAGGEGGALVCVQ